jgi:hypothetical protein
MKEICGIYENGRVLLTGAKYMQFCCYRVPAEPSLCCPSQSHSVVRLEAVKSGRAAMLPCSEVRFKKYNCRYSKNYISSSTISFMITRRSFGGRPRTAASMPVSPKKLMD